MELEIGKTYDVSPYMKKSLYEIEMFKHEKTNKCLNVETCWRSGTFRVRIEDHEDLEELEQCVGKDAEVFDYESFQNIEMLDCWDGCSEEFVYYGSGETAWSDDETELLEEQYEEDEDSFGFFEFLEDKGYISLDCNYQIYNGVIVEEAEEELEALE